MYDVDWVTIFEKAKEILDNMNKEFFEWAQNEILSMLEKPLAALIVLVAIMAILLIAIAIFHK